jgi:hypothetical protein
MRFRFFLVLSLIALAAHGDDTATARLRFQEGVELYDKGQFDKARAAFLQAWVLKKHPSILLNLAQSCLKSGRPGEAARDFVQLLHDPAVTPAQKTEAEKGLIEARAKDGRIDVQTAPNTEISIDGERMGIAPMEAIDVDPGAHTVHVKGEPEQKVTVAIGQILVVKIGTLSAPVPSASTAPSASAGDAGAPPPVTTPDESFLGGHGESCRSRADCKSNLKCIQKVCIDENAPPPPPPPSQGEPAPEEETENPWLAFRLTGVHPFVGLELSGGPAFAVLSFGGRTFNDPNAEGTGLFALRGGVFIDHHELALELSPFTYMPYNTSYLVIGQPFRGAAFQLMGTYGYFIPIREGNVSVYWPLRTGIGVFAGGDNTASLAYFQVRADLVGVAIRVGHLMIDLTLPSFRYGVTDTRGATLHVMGWHIGGNVSYVF